MFTVEQLINKINAGEMDKTLLHLYGTKQAVTHQSERYKALLLGFDAQFPNREVAIFSAPGRSEIGGNHTDHQNGKVLAASINLDAVAIVSRRDDNIINLHSQGFIIAPVDCNETDINSNEFGRSEALIRGVVAGLTQRGYHVGGFDAVMNSEVLGGSGLSSSAAFEVLLGTILNHLFNNNQIPAMELAQIGQYAENVYFDKPCGLLDQSASSVGGFITIDFKDNSNPIVEQIDFDFTTSGYSLCIVDTGGNHCDLTDDYAAVPQEMKEVANLLGVEKLSLVEYSTFLANLPKLRETCSDRALLRAFHLFEENKRVDALVAALKANDFNTFKQLVQSSGHSSFEYLQNVYPVKNVEEQGLSLGLALSQHLLEGKGAWRVHGGGFAGTIQAFVPNDLVETYQTSVEALFGKGTCYLLQVRPVGGVKVV
ncbi:MAG: galactokinase [Erysipelotrichaceae bacterium]